MNENRDFFGGALQCDGVVDMQLVRFDNARGISHNLRPYICSSDGNGNVGNSQRFSVLLNPVVVYETGGFILKPTILGAVEPLSYVWIYVDSNGSNATSTASELILSCTSIAQNGTEISLMVTSNGRTLMAVTNLWVIGLYFHDVSMLLSDQYVNYSDKKINFRLTADQSTAGKVLGYWTSNFPGYGYVLQWSYPYTGYKDRVLSISANGYFRGVKISEASLIGGNNYMALGGGGVLDPLDDRGREVTFTENYEMRLCGSLRTSSDKTYVYSWLKTDHPPLVINVQKYTVKAVPSFEAELLEWSHAYGEQPPLPPRIFYIPISVSGAMGNITYGHFAGGGIVVSIVPHDMSGKLYSDGEFNSTYKDSGDSQFGASVVNLSPGQKFSHLAYVRVEFPVFFKYPIQVYLTATDSVTGHTANTEIYLVPAFIYSWDVVVSSVSGTWYANGSPVSGTSCNFTGNPAFLPGFDATIDPVMYEATARTEDIYVDEGDYVRFIVIFDPNGEVKDKPAHYPSFIRPGHRTYQSDPDTEEYYTYDKHGNQNTYPTLREGTFLGKWNEKTNTAGAGISQYTGIPGYEPGEGQIVRVASAQLLAQFDMSVGVQNQGGGENGHKHSLTWTFGPVFIQHNGLVLQDEIGWLDNNNKKYADADEFQEFLWESMAASGNYDLEWVDGLQHFPVDVVDGKTRMHWDGQSAYEMTLDGCLPFTRFIKPTARVYVKPRVPLKMVGSTVVYVHEGATTLFEIGITGTLDKPLPLDSYSFHWTGAEDGFFTTNPPGTDGIKQRWTDGNLVLWGGTVRTRNVTRQDDGREFTCIVDANLHGGDGAPEQYRRKVILRVTNPQPIVTILPVYMAAGQTQATMTVLVSSGTPPYLYAWDSGETTESITISGTAEELHNHFKRVKVTDFYGNEVNCVGMIYFL